MPEVVVGPAVVKRDGQPRQLGIGTAAVPPPLKRPVLFRGKIERVCNLCRLFAGQQAANQLERECLKWRWASNGSTRRSYCHYGSDAMA